ncbi:prion-like-(Q/N-rich) domain-bearing protein 25 [Leptidea sinapis]|uniref:prion-like-(Q/N-rich) domain-bearing protein 25 n=1 Tax=Leptidea sinapis TaxID=189913 RepID=UPI0021C3F4D9|nr:prion-like-(Q/N-rich) domain-bearing protein 25 [Leptidea sinapis]
MASLSIHQAAAVWTCTTNEECSILQGGICNEGVCQCPPGQQSVKGGTVCVGAGTCGCREGFHYFLGRCWRTVGFGEVCSHNEECLDLPRDPYSLSCDGTCKCAAGYQERQRGECRRFSTARAKVFNCCISELGSPSTPEQCDGLLSVVIDGICACRPNFFYDINMRDCIKVSRSLAVDSCVIDEACHTFGVAARCGQPQDPWQMRNCECIPEDSVWDAERNLCRLFAGVGETCTMDSDCLAGEIEIQCVEDDQGVGYCRCPPHLTEYEGLCLTSGLKLGESCQLSQECTGTDNAVCTNGTCSCSEGYQQIGDTCAPVIGGACLVNEDCAIANTVCKNGTTGRTCQCEDEFVAYEDICWEVANGFEANCTVSAQCTERLGKSSACVSSQCVCTHGNHHRDGSCWPVTELFSPCSRTSQCYLADLTDRTVCRNGLCQCDFDYPFSEELGTCKERVQDLEVKEKEKEMEIHGIEEKINENTISVVQGVAKILNVSPDDIEDAMRVKTK